MLEMVNKAFLLLTLLLLDLLLFCICHPDLTGRESGSNKQVASKSCAMSLVRQLFHLGVIEAYSGEKKKKKENEVWSHSNPHSFLPRQLDSYSFLQNK